METEYILGSHNSLSYLPIKHWWQKITAPWTRCQNLTLREQYDMGVRLFDIRVRYDKDFHLKFCHNNVIFKYSIDEFYNDLRDLPGKVYIRLVLDMRYMPDNPESYKMKFLLFADYFKNIFADKVTLVEVRVFWEWKDYSSELDLNSNIKLYEIYSSVSNTLYKYLPTKWFAKVVNKQLRILDYNCIKGCLLIDYVQL